MITISVGNNGFVTLVDKMGSDLSVVNAARVSMGKKHDVFTPEDEKLINYLAREGHTCYDAHTEVFTNFGWKFWGEILLTDKLAAVNPDGTFKFETPKRLVADDYSGKMLQVIQGQVDFCVTPNHRLWVAKRKATSFHDYDFLTAEESFDKQYRVKTTAKYQSESTDGTYDEGFLYGFFLGDGSRASTNRITFHLKKERKLAELRSVLTALNVSFTETTTTTGGTKITVVNSDLLFTGTSKTKQVWDSVFDTKSILFLVGLFNGLLATDGSVKRGSYTYSTVSEQLAKDFQRLGTLLDKNVVYNAKQGDCFKLMILNRSTEPRLNDAGKHNTWVDYSGKVYCAEVSTGLLLVRRNGKQVISGNSPFRHAFLSFHVKCPLFVKGQFDKHQVGISINTISGRYVQTADDWYIPTVFRKAASNVKQGSQDEPIQYNDTYLHVYENHYVKSLELYKLMIEAGVCREQARTILPQGMNTEFYMSGSLQAFVHFIKLRTDSHAQREIQDYGFAFKELVEQHFPVSTKALLEL